MLLNQVVKDHTGTGSQVLCDAIHGLVFTIIAARDGIGEWIAFDPQW